MDFKRIARIFIIAFGLLNIYLVIGVVERQDIQNISSRPSSDTLTNIEASDIDLPENLSATEIEDQDVYSLQINTDPLLENEVEESDTHTGTIDETGAYYESFPSNPIVLEGNSVDGYTEEDLNAVRSFVASDRVLFGEEYVFNRFDVEENRFVFYQEVDGIPIADGTSEVSLFVNDEGNIISFEQTYAGPATRQGSPLQLINGTRAIEVLFLNNEIRQGSTVQLPILTYRRALHLEDLSMYSPAWVVNVEHASERNTFRVDAVNGTIIRQPVAAPTEENEEEADEATDNEQDDET